MAVSITPSIVRELLDYDPDTGVFVWKKRDERWCKTQRACSIFNSRDAGKRAGCAKADKRNGYQRRDILILGSPQLEHRLAWMWMTGEVPPEQIDHKNRDATDNRWINLRSSCNPVNSRNRSLSIANTSGVTGVYWMKDRSLWHAAPFFDGKSRHLGFFPKDDLDIAAMEVLEFYAEHGFDKDHGLTIAKYHERGGKECL